MEILNNADSGLKVSIQTLVIGSVLEVVRPFSELPMCVGDKVLVANICIHTCSCGVSDLTRIYQHITLMTTYGQEFRTLSKEYIEKHFKIVHA